MRDFISMIYILILLKKISKLDKLLITTGDPYANGQNIELIHLTDSKKVERIGCNSNARYGSVGGIIDNQILICGGKVGYHGLNTNYFQDGFVLFKEKLKMINMTEKRAHHSSIVLNDAMLFIVGGTDGVDDLATTEFVSLHQTVKGKVCSEKNIESICSMYLIVLFYLVSVSIC